MEVKRKNQITLEVFSFKTREVAYVKFLTKITRSERVDESDDGKQVAWTARIINLEDGLQYRMVCPTLLVSALVEEDIDYVFKCFEVTVSKDPKPGKRYKEVECWEIDEPIKTYTG